jgi:hypothetical protein
MQGNLKVLRCHLVLIEHFDFRFLTKLERIH